jgi:two-component sensor histidine kinase
MQAPLSHTFKFPNSAQSLVSSLRHILDFISGNLPRNADGAKVNFKLKVIVTELLNNALKHAESAETRIHVLIGEKTIRIEKTDYGNRFDPENLITAKNNTPGSRVMLTTDSLNNLYAIIEKDTYVKFYCEENAAAVTPDVNDINEHFGLLIITRSSDEFTYRYDITSGLNTFGVNLALQ